MAWVSKYLQPSSATDLLQKIGAELVNMGWTLHDDIDSDTKVYKSNGEGGDRIYEYIWMDVSGSNVLMAAYGWWDNVGHSGSCRAYYSATYSYITYAASGWYLISGNKNLVAIKRLGQSGSNHQILFGHFPKRFYEKPLGTLQNSETGGSNVVVELDDTTGFFPNKTYQIFGDAGEGRDMVKVDAVDHGASTVTINSLPRDYSAGSMIGAMPSTFGYLGYAGSRSYWHNTCYYTLTGTTNGSSYNVHYCSVSQEFLLSQAYLDPEAALGAGTGTTGLYVLQPLTLTEMSSDRHVGYSDDLILLAPENSVDRIYGIADPAATVESGTATGGSATTIVCAGKGWTDDEWIGKVVLITDGTGAGQIRKITDNNSDTLTVSTWNVNPAAGSSVFYICDEAYRVCWDYYLAVKENP